mgnify:CR=1 FL=1|tara:strand:+ start:10855 stop:12843 length:1989 start_codon:yes stop_codon:yes gene_type:complete
MSIKNQIISYFVASTVNKGEMPIVYKSPVTMGHDIAKKLLLQQLKKTNDDRRISKDPLLHVCYDLDSKQIYVPNANEFNEDEKRPLLQAALIKVMNEYGDYKGTPPIEGSPFSSLRVRAISSFGYSQKMISNHFDGREFNDLPVIEANLERMPTTTETLNDKFKSGEQYVGGYVGPETASSITFIDEIDIAGRKRTNPLMLAAIPTPFILINISAGINPDPHEKEWAVLSGYRNYLYDEKTYSKNESVEPQNINASAHLYTIKHHLYLGYPFEEVCSIALQSVKSFEQLDRAIKLLMFVANDLQNEGYPNPAQIPYYYSFKIDPETFPLNLSSVMEDGQFASHKQLDHFKLIDFDKNTSQLIVESPVFMQADIIANFLKSKTRPIIARYNPTFDKIDIKSQSGIMNEKVNRKQGSKIKALVNYDNKSMYPDRDDSEPLEFRTDERARGISLSNTQTSHLRKLSDYHFACDYIKKMCEKRNMPFIDVDVLIGPLERIFGAGTLGGFMGKKQFDLSNLKYPYEIEKGIFVSPPFISVDSVSMTGYPAQTRTLIHEYSHNLYSITNPDHEHEYNKDPSLKDRDYLAYWESYLSDPDERLAHAEEIRHEIEESGLSIDEIIRNKSGGAITNDNADTGYPISLKFKQLVEEVVQQMEEDNKKNEKPT